MSAPAIDPSDEWLQAIQSWGHLRFGEQDFVEPDFGLNAGGGVADVDLVDIAPQQFFLLLDVQRQMQEVDGFLAILLTYRP